jgi:hypothetical protein
LDNRPACYLYEFDNSGLDSAKLWTINDSKNFNNNKKTQNWFSFNSLLLNLAI